MPSTIVIADRDELRLHVHREMALNGPRCDLNHFDVSAVESFSSVFRNTAFNGDISGWDTRNMRAAMSLFVDCPFNGDISNWNTSSLRNATSMFAYSEFNGDLSRWDVSKVETMALMFESSWFRGDISQWRVQDELVDTRAMFKGAVFSGDLSGWTLRPDCQASDMFDPSYKGSMPQPASKRDEAYHQMIGSFFHFVHYLKRSGLNSTGIACMLDYAVAPVWVNDEDHAWVQSQKKIGMDLGIYGQDLFRMVVQNAKMKVSAEDLAVRQHPGLFA